MKASALLEHNGNIGRVSSGYVTADGHTDWSRYHDDYETRERTMRAMILLVLILAGCTDTAEMFPLNDQAQQLGVPAMEFRRGLPHGPIKITMPNGEVLVGSFQVAIGGGTATAFGAGGSATAVGVSAGGNFYAAARGVKTTITCQGNVSFGHGGGVCRTQDGAAYQVQI